MSHDVSSKLGDGAQADNIDAVVSGIYATHQPSGLKSLETVPKADEPGEFEVHAHASPGRVTGHFRVSDLQLSFPRTAVLIQISRGGDVVFRRKVPQGRNPAGDTSTARHAEPKIIAIVRDEFFSKPENRGPFDIDVAITRSPCPDCGPRLEEFKQSLGRRVSSFSIRFASAYRGSDNTESIDVLRSLKKHGFDLSVLSLKQIVQEELLGPGQELTAEDEAKLEAKVADARKALNLAKTKRGR